MNRNIHLKEKWNRRIPNMDQTPKTVLERIMAYLPPIDRIQVQNVCKRFRDMFKYWNDIISIDVRLGVYVHEDLKQRCSFQFHLTSLLTDSKVTYRVRLFDQFGNIFRIRNITGKYGNKSLKTLLLRLNLLKKITIWDCALNGQYSKIFARFDSLKTLILWNCLPYFGSQHPDRHFLQYLFSKPLLSTILVLDSSSGKNLMKCDYSLTRCIVECINGPVSNLQLTGMYISTRVFGLLCSKLSQSLKRLSFGCTYGDATKRSHYIKSLKKLELVENTDLPPYIFHLNDSLADLSLIDGVLQKLPITSLGFRHYNSSVLFQFIQLRLPEKIRILRIYHSRNRIPNFAQLCLYHLDCKAALSSSLFSAQQSFEVFSSPAPYTASNNNLCDKASDSLSSFCKSSALLDRFNLKNGEKIENCTEEFLSFVVFAIEESFKTSVIESMPNILHRFYSGLRIFYVRENQNFQAVLGRMASPMQSPYVYSKSGKREVRVVKGDLVRPIPLASLGMETDYEASDWEDILCDTHHL